MRWKELSCQAPEQTGVIEHITRDVITDLFLLGRLRRVSGLSLRLDDHSPFG